MNARLGAGAVRQAALPPQHEIFQPMQRELRLLDMALADGPREAFARLRAVFYLYAHARSARLAAAPSRERVIRKPARMWIGQVNDCPGQIIICFDPNAATEFIFQINPAGAIVAGFEFTQHALQIIAGQEHVLADAVSEQMQRAAQGRRLDS